MSKVLIYSQEDLGLILELEKQKNELLQHENQELKEKNIVSMLIHVLNAHQVISCTLFH